MQPPAATTLPHAILKSLSSGQTLGAQEAEAAFEAILSGRFDDAQIAGFLAMIAARGPTVDELVGGARVMRRHVTRVPVGHDPAAPVIDTCGTGGAPKCFNVSTAAAIITAAAAPGRVRVAKHGSTSRTGRGSSEVMAKLGVNLAMTPEVQARCLTEIGVCFCSAVNHHPAMKHAAGPRKSLGFPTIFNLLGPLTNPAGASRQLIGCYSIGLAEKIAHTLARLGAERAMVVCSHDGLDELSISDTSMVFHVEGGRVTGQVIDPLHLGVPRARLEELQADSLESAASMIERVLRGEGGPAADMACLSAAAALVVAGLATDLKFGLEKSRAAVASGKAAEVLGRLAAVSNQN